MKSKILTHLILVCLFQSCTAPVDDPLPKEEDAVVVREELKQLDNHSTGENIDTSTTIHIGRAEVELGEVEEGVEAAIDITQTIVEAGTEMLDAKRRNDSIKLSRREKMFAYQLGIPCRNEKLILDAYKNLTDKEGVYVFKKSRKEYLLVKYQSKSEGDLDKELVEYRSLHTGEVIGEIKKIDLVRECGKKKSPRLTGWLKSRKSKIQLECLTCR